MSDGRGNLVFHIGGKLSLSGRVRYVGGRTVVFEDVDVDKIGYFTIRNLAQNSGFEPSRIWFAKPGLSLSKGLTEIVSDAQVSVLVVMLLESKSMDIYIEGEERDESDPEEEVEKDEELERVEAVERNEEEERDEEVERYESVENVYEEGRAEIHMNEVIESEYEASDAEIENEENEEGGKPSYRDVKVAYNPECDHKELLLKVGLSFDTLEQFKEAVQDYAIFNGVNVRWVRADSQRMEVECVDGCPWRVYAGWLQREKTVVVKTCCLEHKCTRSLKNRQATTKWLAREFIKMNRLLDSMKARDVMVDLMEKYSVQVNKLQVYRAKWEAQKIVNGTVHDHYKKVRSYVAYLGKKCPDGTFKGEHVAPRRRRTNSASAL